MGFLAGAAGFLSRALGALRFASPLFGGLFRFGSAMVPVLAAFAKSVAHLALNAMRRMKNMAQAALFVAGALGKRVSRRVARLGALAEVWRIVYAFYELLVRAVNWAFQNLPWGGLLFAASWIELCRAGLVHCNRPTSSSSPGSLPAYLEP